MVCLGNICRSPVAEVVLATRLAAAGLDSRVRVSSAGTGDWHRGEPMDRRAAASLTASGYDPSAHRAAQFDRTWADRYDLILAMDSSNYTDVVDLVSYDDRHRIRMYRSFDPLAADGHLDVPDPWYGGPEGFDDVLAMAERTSDVLVSELQAQA